MLPPCATHREHCGRDGEPKEGRLVLDIDVEDREVEAVIVGRLRSYLGVRPPQERSTDWTDIQHSKYYARIDPIIRADLAKKMLLFGKAMTTFINNTVVPLL